MRMIQRAPGQIQYQMAQTKTKFKMMENPIIQEGSLRCHSTIAYEMIQSEEKVIRVLMCNIKMIKA